MRENRTYGSEGGEGLHPFPTPIEFVCPVDFLTASEAGIQGDRCEHIPWMPRAVFG